MPDTELDFNYSLASPHGLGKYYLYFTAEDAGSGRVRAAQGHVVSKGGVGVWSQVDLWVDMMSHYF